MTCTCTNMDEDTIKMIGHRLICPWARSPCCGSSIRIHNGDEGTHWYECGNCEQPI